LVLESYSKQELVLKRCGIQSPESMEIVRKETHILQRFSGPNIVKLYASDMLLGRTSPTSKEALLLLEFCPGGHLLDRLNTRRGVQLPAASIYRIFGQILVALRPFHESTPPIVHRDLKLENILFGVDGNVRLCDFGSCVEGYIDLKTSSEKASAEETIAKETTQMYRAPEMIDLYMRDVLTEKTDIWALGCILYAISFLSHPFQDAGSLVILSAKISMPNDSTIGDDAKTLITRMLDVSRHCNC
jgi:serine/threonine protein kinase